MKQEVLRELDFLLNIPLIYQIIFHRVEELKYLFVDEINYYKSLDNIFRKLVYGEMRLVDSTDQNAESERKILSVLKFHFHLNKNEAEQWEITKFDPLPPSSSEICDLFPEEMIDYLAKYKIQLQEIGTVKNIKIPTIDSIFFDARFVKYSDSHIMGALIRKQIRDNSVWEAEKDSPKEEIYNYNKKTADRADYRELLFYMEKYPLLRKYFFNEFHMKMKPLINGNLAKITACSQPVDLF